MKCGYIAAPGGKIPMSGIVLGSCYFGTDIPGNEACRLLDLYYQKGGRTVDTARMYADWLPGGDSASERVIGQWLAQTGVRKELTLVTKGGHPPRSNMAHTRLDPASLTYDIHKSLEVLQTDYIDVYLLHRDDVTVPVEGIMDTLHSFVQQGLVRAIGASNWSIDRILAANAYAQGAGKTPFTVSQIQWSLVHTTPQIVGDPTLVCMDDSQYGQYKKAELPVMAFSSQGKGFFSKYLAGGEAALSAKVKSRYLSEINLRRATRVKALSDSLGVSPAAVTMAYITSNPLAAFAVAGCSNATQLEDTLRDADLCLTPQQIEFLES